MAANPLDVFAPLAHGVVSWDFNLKQIIVGHVRRQLGRTLTSAATDTSTPTTITWKWNKSGELRPAQFCFKYLKQRTSLNLHQNSQSTLLVTLGQVKFGNYCWGRIIVSLMSFLSFNQHRHRNSQGVFTRLIFIYGKNQRLFNRLCYYLLTCTYLLTTNSL